MKKQIIKRLTALLLAVVCTATFYTMAYAAAIVYNTIELEHIAEIENQEYTDENDNRIVYTAVGGIAAGTNRTSMFVMKSENRDTDYVSERMALFYDFPDINDLTKRKYYFLPQAGHANGMAIDDYNIYICGWTKENELLEDAVEELEPVYPDIDKSTEVPNNWIIKLPRNKFSDFRKAGNGYTILKDDPNTTEVEGYTLLRPIIDGTTDTLFKKDIRNITKYNSNKTFLVQYFMDGIGNNLAYTTARLVTENGVEKFYVSIDPDDIFIVENNVLFYDGTLQDICYSPGNGLFIPIWYSPSSANSPNANLTNKNKSVIMWVDLSTTNNPKLSTITIEDETYRYYTQPDKINVNQSGKGYDKFEVESIAITDDDEMLFSANIKKAKGQQGELTNIDSVFKLTHDNGQNFVLQ